MAQFPPVLGNITSLLQIAFSTESNQPQPFPDLSRLTKLYGVSIDAVLTGSVPPWLADMRLSSLSLSRTLLNGQLSASQFQLLQSLSLSSNSPFLRLPPLIADNCTLRDCKMSNSSIAGAFPKQLLNCTRLTQLDLSDNYFGPLVPKELIQHQSLLNAILKGNSFSSVEPPTQNSLKLQWIDLSKNAFAGPLSPELVRTVATNARQWVFDGNHLECPKVSISASLSSWNKSSLPSSYAFVAHPAA